jgi:hypothetical protein
MAMNDGRPTLLVFTLALALAACGGDGSHASIGGTLSGLNAGQSVVLQDNDVDTLQLTSNGAFRFAATLAGGAGYRVTILTQPAGEICEVANGVGQVDPGADSINGVAVTCVATSPLGGTISGLAAGTAMTLSNGAVLLPVAANGTFAFPGRLLAGTAYEIRVATQPRGQTCTVRDGAGSVNAASDSAVTVICTWPPNSYSSSGPLR